MFGRNNYQRRPSIWILASLMLGLMAPVVMALDDYHSVAPGQAAQQSQMDMQQQTIQQAQQYIGKDVKDAQGQSIGRVSDVVIDRKQHRTAFLIVTPANSPDKLVPIPWSAVQVPAGATADQALMVNITQDRLAQAPSFQKGEKPDLAQGRWRQNIDSFYGGSYAYAGEKKGHIENMREESRESRHAGELAEQQKLQRELDQSNAQARAMPPVAEQYATQPSTPQARPMTPREQVYGDVPPYGRTAEDIRREELRDKRLSVLPEQQKLQRELDQQNQMGDLAPAPMNRFERWREARRRDRDISVLAEQQALQREYNRDRAVDQSVAGPDQSLVYGSDVSDNRTLEERVVQPPQTPAGTPQGPHPQSQARPESQLRTEPQAPGAQAQQLPQGQGMQMISQVIGMKLNDRAGQEAGTIKELVYDARSGNIAYAIVSLKDARGQQAAVPWRAIHVQPDQRTAQMNADRQTLQQSAFKEGERPNFSDPSFSRNLDQQFGLRPSSDVYGYGDQQMRSRQDK